MLVCAVAFVLQQAPEWVGTVNPPTHAPVVRDRAAFTKKFFEINEGMTPREVERILGKPDDVLDPEDCFGSHRCVDTEWLYGSIGKDSLAAYGTVGFQNGKVLSGYGSVEFDTRVVSPVLRSFAGKNPNDEAGVSDALQKLWRVVATEEPWNAGHAARERMEAANALIALGRDDARIALAEAGRLPGMRFGSHNLWSVIHALFLTDGEGSVQTCHFGRWEVASGIPFLLEGQWSGNGWSTLYEFDEVEKSHVFRRTPYIPRDMKSIREFAERNWVTETGQAGLIAAQVENLLATLVAPPPAREMFRPSDRVERARQMIASLGDQPVVWDSKLNMLTLVGGKRLDVKRTYYRAYIWQPGPLTGTGVRITAKRVSPFDVYVTMQLIELTDNPSPPPPSFEVSVVGAIEETRIAFASFDSGEFKKGSAASSHVTNRFFSEWKNLDNGHYGSGGGFAGIGLDRGMVYSKTISLHDRAQFRLVLESEGKRFVSPVLVP